MKQTVYTLTLLLFSISSFCQKDSYTRYSILEGLPSSQVYDVIQDDYGFIWFSTDKGLSRYDGFNFQNFTTEDGLINNVVFDFYKQKNGDIWCTTLSAELFKIEGNPPQFTPHKYNTLIKEHSGGQVPYSTFIIREGGLKMAFLRTTEHLHINKKGEVISTPRLLPTTKKYNSLRCVVLKENARESFFFLTSSKQLDKVKHNYDFLTETAVESIRDEALYFDQKKTSVFLVTDKVFIQSNNKLRELQLSKNCIASGKLDDNHFWIGLDGGGGYIYDLSGNRIEHFLAEHSVTQIFKDAENHIWISTLSSGVYLQRETPLKSMDPVFENDLYVNDLGIDKDGNLYVGYYNGNISKYNRKEGLTSFYKTSLYCPALINFNKKKGITHFHAGDRVFSNNGQLGHELTCRNLYSHQDLLFLVNDNTLVYKRGDTTSHTIFGETRVSDIQFFNNRYYAGTEAGLLFIPKDIEKKARKDESLFSVPIRVLDSLYTYLVIGTKEEGIALMNAKGHIVLRLKTEHGLSSNFITNLYVENDSVLWASTSKGLSRIYLDKDLNYQITSLKDEHGPLVSGVEDIEIIQDTLWIGTQSGLYYMAKDRFAKESNLHRNPRVLFHAIANDTLALSENSNIGADSRIEFHFQAISFYENIKPRYRYKLSNMDKDWKYTLDQSIIYENLTRGDYTFSLQFCNSDDCWTNTERTISFSVNSGFYWGWWMNGIVLIGISSIFYFFYRNRNTSTNKLKPVTEPEDEVRDIIPIKHLGTSIKLETQKILFVKSSGNYLEFHTTTKKYLTRMAMNDFLKAVPKPNEFVRVHKSYSVRLDKIDQKNSRKLWIQDQEIPIGRVYKGELMDAEV
jgi:ligand-binding sensor domain-containing protein